MSVWPCWNSGHGPPIVDWLAQFASSPAQAKYKGKVLVGTFLASHCTFGQGNGWNAGWDVAVRQPLLRRGVDMFFVPVIFDDVRTLGSNSVME